MSCGFAGLQLVLESWKKQTGGNTSATCFFFQAEDGIRDAQESRGLGDVYKRQDPDFVVKIARAYNGNVLEALVAADFITPEEAGKGGSNVDAELHHALKVVQLHGNELSAIADDLTRELERVKGLPAEVDDLAARRSNRQAGSVDFTAYGVADDSPDEGGEPDDYVP